MSHNVELKGAKITDLVALEKAVGELSSEGARCRFDANAKSFRTYSGESTHCDAAIIMGDGRHDIGLRKQPDGSYQPVFDPYGFTRDLAVPGRDAENFQPEVHGRNYDAQQATSVIGKLLQRYNVCKVEREAAMHGQSFERTSNAKTGVVELTITV